MRAARRFQMQQRVAVSLPENHAQEGLSIRHPVDRHVALGEPVPINSDLIDGRPLVPETAEHPRLLGKQIVSLRPLVRPAEIRQEADRMPAVVCLLQTLPGQEKLESIRKRRAVEFKLEAESGVRAGKNLPLLRSGTENLPAVFPGNRNLRGIGIIAPVFHNGKRTPFRKKRAEIHAKNSFF